MEISYSTLLVFIILSHAISAYSFIKLKITKRKLKSSEKYNKTLQTLHDDVRCFRHDLNNMVTTIGGYVVSDDMDGLKNYYNQLENDCIRLNNLSVLTPTLINDYGVYNLLVEKYQLADKARIKMSFELMLNLKELKMNIYEFTRTLGILLDNAIEAASVSTEKIINIFFRNEASNNRQVVIIENSYDNKNVNIENIFNKNKTSKKNHSGLGLFEVKKILSRNSNLNLFTSKDGKLFKQQLEIYY